MTTTPVSSLISNLPPGGALTGLEPVPMDNQPGGPTQQTNTGAIAQLYVFTPRSAPAPAPKVGRAYFDTTVFAPRLFGPDGNWHNFLIDGFATFVLGAGDNAARLQAAVDEATANIQALMILGHGFVGTPVNVNGPTRIMGHGRGVTIITAGANGAAFNILTGAPVSITDLTIQAANAGALSTFGISVNTPVFANSNSLVRDVEFVNLTYGVQMLRAAQWTVDNCWFMQGVGSSAGVYVSDSFNADEGDSLIINSTFITSSATGVQAPNYGVLHASAGGLRVINNKFNNIQFPFALVLANGANTGDLIILGNSIENFGASAITLERAGATGTFESVQINNNQISNFGSALSYQAILVPTDANGVWLYDFQANGNIMRLDTTGNCIGIDIDTVTGFTAIGNTMRSVAGTNIRFQLGSQATAGVVGITGGAGIFGASTDAGGNTHINPF